jgi:hypothetical protein
MAIILETGSGTDLSANSYTTLASADAYFESRGYTTWTDGDDDLKEYAIINAALYMETLDWKGIRTYSTDPLVWPRRGVFDSDGWTIYSDVIPKQVKQAQCEIAYRYYLGKNPLGDISSGDGYVTKEVIGPIEVDYSKGYSANIKFPEVLALLRPWLKSTLSVEIERA